MRTPPANRPLPPAVEGLRMVDETAQVDATRPWLAHLRPALDGALAAWQAGSPVALALSMANSGSAGSAGSAGPAGPDGAAGLPRSVPRFVPQSALPEGEAYEAFIYRSASVPTRCNLHDFFNGLVWIAQPALKRRLNALQAAEINRAGVGQQRGPLRDALTLFDENGALLDAPAVLRLALQARDWHALFITHRARWAEARLLIIGHALLDKLATAPRKALTAHVLVGDALTMTPAGWAAKPFLPLPVLGVPGWWPANDDPAFYDDAAVFRPPRR